MVRVTEKTTMPNKLSTECGVLITIRVKPENSKYVHAADADSDKTPKVFYIMSLINETFWFYNVVMCPKVAGRMRNTVDQGLQVREGIEDNSKIIFLISK